MKISIDLDGVLWHNQKFFRAFMRSMQASGHQVGILTAHKVIHRPADLALMEKRGFPAPDFYIGRPLDMPHREEGYGAWKAAVVMNEGIDIHFEDGLAMQMRHELRSESYRIFPVFARGGEDEHFE